MQTHVIPRDGDRDLEFVGEQIGFGTSQDDHRPKPRWFELTIYVTDTGKFVVSGVGRTTVRAGDMVWDPRTRTEVKAEKDEYDRYWASVHDTPEDVVENLYREDKDGVRYLTHTARDALEQAAEVDERFDAALVETI